MERLRFTFSRLNTTRIGMLVIGLALVLTLVPRLTTPPPAPAAPAAPQAVGGPPDVGPERPLPPPAPRSAEPEHPIAVAPPPAIPHALPQPEQGPPPPPGQLDIWVSSIVHWLALTGATALLACVALIGLLLWRSWWFRDRDIVSEI